METSDVLISNARAWQMPIIHNNFDCDWLGGCQMMALIAKYGNLGGLLYLWESCEFLTTQNLAGRQSGLDYRRHSVHFNI